MAKNSKKSEKMPKVSGHESTGLNERVKRMDIHDLQLTKISVFAGALFLVSVWPWFKNLILEIGWGWWLALTVVAAFKPMLKFWGKD